MQKRPAKKILDEMRRKRGYLLSYHRLMGADPELLAAYDAFYSRMTLAARALSATEKETVWIALNVATRARVLVHFERARRVGMGADAIADAVALGAACEGWDAFGFSRDAYGKFISKIKSENRYLRTVEAARGRIRPALAEIAAAVAQAGRRRPEAMVLHLGRAFRAGAKRAQVAEALTYCLLHCGGPTMLEAVDAWARAARGGRIPAPF